MIFMFQDPLSPKTTSLVVGLYIYSVSAKVRCHPNNFGTARAIIIKIGSRHSKVAMRYTRKPLTAPPGG